MAIKIEEMEINGVDSIHTFSTLGVYIKDENGVKYTDAIDPKEKARTYTETGEIIEISSLASLFGRVSKIEEQQKTQDKSIEMNAQGLEGAISALMEGGE